MLRGEQTGNLWRSKGKPASHCGRPQMTVKRRTAATTEEEGLISGPHPQTLALSGLPYWKDHGEWSWTDLSWLSSYVANDALFNFTEPQFHPVRNGDENCPQGSDE